MTITEYIKKLTKHYITEHKLSSAKDINNGFCIDFAEDLEMHFSEGFVLGFTDIFDEDGTQDWFINDGKSVLNKYSKGKHSFSQSELINMPYHVWFFFNNKHYDSECPEGVDDFFDLPFYKRLSSK